MVKVFNWGNNITVMLIILMMESELWAAAAMYYTVDHSVNPMLHIFTVEIAQHENTNTILCSNELDLSVCKFYKFC